MAQMEMVEFGVEQGQMLQVLMRHCQTMKRQETRLRLATALLLTAFLATSLWLQFHSNTSTDSFAGAHTEALKAKKTHKRQSVHLEPKSKSSPEKQLLEWYWRNESPYLDNFNLKNATELHISKKGLYLINLKMSYRIAYGQCQDNTDKIMTLEVNVTQEHSNYEGERVILKGSESMLCSEYWLQSMTLSRPIMLEDNSSLRVRIKKDNFKFVSWSETTYLDVTYL
ncbi:uncharacterized protein [Danio rerio]|uniref:THD domain-containing protein n=1 Tax=Danio rerio TaxID=7955 RepID=A0A8M1RLY1_DANRE|nr:uncharacterized protein LOC100535208 [Danio rerio]XP_021332173.1 uncharacterized protein LOC100535208 [Danio rerio]|eukprot:XP_003198686.2 uncharacterized protein LOC100535208 [Danio rerio]